MGTVSRRADPENNSWHGSPPDDELGPPPRTRVQLSGAENAPGETSGHVLMLGVYVGTLSFAVNAGKGVARSPRQTCRQPPPPALVPSVCGRAACPTLLISNRDVVGPGGDLEVASVQSGPPFAAGFVCGGGHIEGLLCVRKRSSQGSCGL